MSGPQKLTVEQVYAIRADERYAAEIAADYGVTTKHVRRIKRGEVWPGIHSPVHRRPQGRHPKLTAEQAAAIKVDTRTQREIAADYGVCEATVSHIKTGRNWGHL